ncbi:MAG TPA: hypothetical protein VM325_16050 [Alphaproteobacteria bacterium]|nr:hypothetical protein [Alphaproteobacteria bacterium]
MKRSTQLWFLLPHAISAACFAAAFAWLFSVGTNRTLPVLYLGIVGFVALAAALIATIAGTVSVIRHGIGRYWPWLLAHLAGLALALVLAGSWIGAHLA